MQSYLLSAASASVIVVLLTALVRRLALLFGILDYPDGVRKLHEKPVPLLGGLGIFAAWVAGVRSGGPATAFSSTLMLAAAVVLVTGVLDDVFTLKPRWKLLGQTGAALVLVAGGLVVERLCLFGFTVELGRLGILFTLLWLVGSMNAVNMLDGLDGLAATVGLIICLALAGMAWLIPIPELVLVVGALCGALAGFLLFNLPPARIYLGDSGSTLIGLIIGGVAIRGCLKAPATAALAAPIAVMAIPIFDGFAAIVRRLLTGAPVSSPDRGQIHHCLKRLGWSNRQVLSGVGVLCALTSSASLASCYFRCDTLAALAMAAVLSGCVAARLFGYHEYRLLLRLPKICWRAFSALLRKIRAAPASSLCPSDDHSNPSLTLPARWVAPASSRCLSADQAPSLSLPRVFCSFADEAPPPTPANPVFPTRVAA